jgi:hypothetical protein
VEICDRLRPIASKVKIPNAYLWQDGMKNIFVTINYKKPTMCIKIHRNNGHNEREEKICGMKEGRETVQALDMAIEELKEGTGLWEPNFRYAMYPTEKFWICSVCGAQSMERRAHCKYCKSRMENADESKHQISVDEILDVANKRLKEESRKENRSKSKDWNEGFNDGMAFALIKILEVKSDMESKDDFE